jgi:hypothetical protein
VSATAPRGPAYARVPLLVLGVAALALGILTGLVRLGFALPAAHAAAQHGPLMVVGFLGTVIGLERAVALGARWAYSAAVAAAVAALAAAAGQLALLRFVGPLAAAALPAVAIAQARRHPSVPSATMAAGALAWAAGLLGWLTLPIDVAALCWVVFLVLTIAAERLELARVLAPSGPVRGAFLAIVALLVAAAALGFAELAAAWRVLGAALAALAAWLARYDIARRTVKLAGLTRYVACCLLVGYAWLALAGGLWLAGAQAQPLARDAALHALFVGFVFSMIFGHAPLIFPALLRVKLPYTPWLYLPFALLHATVAVRLAGDALADAPLRAAGGAGHAVAIAAFIATMLANALRSRRRGAAAP